MNIGMIVHQMGAASGGVSVLAYFVAVVVGSFVIRGMTGFGGNSVGIPPLALVMPLAVLAPAFAVVGFAAGTFQMAVSWREIVWKEIWKSLPPMVTGVVIGSLLFRELAHVVLLKILLGMFISAYSLYAIASMLNLRIAAFGKSSLQPPQARLIASFAVGFLGLLFGQGGSLYAVYMHYINLSKASLRATLSCFLVFSSIIRCIGYASTGFLFTKAVGMTLACALPAMLVGMLIGQYVHAKSNRNAMIMTIMLVLLGTGLALIFA